MKRIFIIIGILAVSSLGVYFVWNTGVAPKADVFVKVKKGRFKIAVNNSGEVFAKNSVDILGPDGLRNVQIWQVKIENIIPEGTIVKEGDFVASLDRSELVDKLKNKQSELDKAISQFTQAKLDTTLELREARDNLVNLKFGMQEKKLELQQSKYEPPATIQRAQIEVEKADRAYSQAVENYQLKREKAVAKVQEAAATLAQAQNSVDMMQNLLDKFTVKAPKDGMLIYAREWNGQKKREGATVGAWEPVVATLPDMSVMVSRTYINEVDIRKIKVGQSVEIGLDAFPEKKLTGKVVEVANVGEQKPNSDAKVFEVNIQINERDTLILPSMTTSNLVVAEVLSDVLSVPLESIHSQGDTLSYVFKKESSGIVRQEIFLGKTNENEAQVLEGLKESEIVMLSKPAGGEKLKLLKLNKKPIDSKKTAKK